jgi:hypothetical protein
MQRALLQRVDPLVRQAEGLRDAVDGDRGRALARHAKSVLAIYGPAP